MENKPGAVPLRFSAFLYVLCVSALNPRRQVRFGYSYG